MQSTPKVSVIIITYQRAQGLVELVKQIKSTFRPDTEILISINGDDSHTELELQKIENIYFEKIQSTTPARARNLLAKKASGDYILFLDDDISLSKNYYQNLISHLNNNVDVIGGPDQTPHNSSFFAKVLGNTLKSPFSTAHTLFRHARTRITSNVDENRLILCNFCIKKDIFNKFQFDEYFYRNEENVLIHQLQDYNLIYDPYLFVYHERKSHPFKLIRAIFNSAFFRAQSFKLYPKSIQIIYFVPSITLLLLLFLPSLSVKTVFASIFLSASLLSSIIIAGLIQAPFALIYQIIINITYAIGFIYGLCKKLPNEKKWKTQSIKS